jgi:hypothetical protein
MIINAHNLKGFQFLLDTEFANAMNDAIPDGVAKALFYDKQALRRKKVKYPWVSASARAVKVPKGEPQEKQRLPLNQLEVEAGKASLLLAIDEFDLVCDEEGLYVDQLRNDASVIADFDERYAVELLTGGFTALSGIEDDTDTFFADSRKASIDLGANSQTYDNKLTDALGATGYDKARKALFKMTDGKGKPRGIGGRGFVLICGPENEAAALDLLKVPLGSGGATNKYYNTAELIVSPYLGASANWFLAAKTAKAAGKPLIKQTNLAWKSRMTGTEDVSAVVDGEILYQNHWRGEHAYGDPQLIVGSTGAG